MADIEQTIKILFPDADSESKFDELTRLTKPQDSGILSFNPIDVSKEIFSAIQAEADRKRRFEDSVIKLANLQSDNQQTANIIGLLTPNKTLLPLERETTESLLLIYHYLESKGIKPGDNVTISAKTAWGEIHAGKFQTDLIKGRPGSRKTAQIIMNGGEELDYKTFAKKYNSRLKAPDKTQ